MNSPSSYSSLVCPIESIDSQLADAEADGWNVVLCDWKDVDDAWFVLLKRAAAMTYLWQLPKSASSATTPPPPTPCENCGTLAPDASRVPCPKCGHGRDCDG